jgi:hypothetical protein
VRRPGTGKNKGSFGSSAKPRARVHAVAWP